MIDWLRECDNVGRITRNNQKKIKQLEDQLCHSATDEEISQNLGLTDKQIKLIRIQTNYQKEPEILFDTTFEKIDFIKKLSSGFCMRDRLILRLYYFEHLTMKQISNQLFISESRISQIHDRLLKRMKEKANGIS